MTAGRTVLLVEDNADNQVVYRVILEHVGFRVLEAWNGEEGVRLAREQPAAGDDQGAEGASY
jgi:CheY-like chemotaxis protein